MADYYQQTVVHQIIADADMTPLERLLLGKIFQSERVNDGWYFFAEDYPAVAITVQRAELEQALASSPDDGTNTAYSCAIEQLFAAEANAAQIELDLSGTSWEFFSQDVVKRSKTLTHISIEVSSELCSGVVERSQPRRDNYGRIVDHGSPDLAEAGLDDAEPPG